MTIDNITEAVAEATGVVAHAEDDSAIAYLGDGIVAGIYGEGDTFVAFIGDDVTFGYIPNRWQVETRTASLHKAEAWLTRQVEDFHAECVA